jgi:predicted transcriptional regulator
MYDMNGENRINARIDDKTRKQLDDLVLTTGRTASHILREAIGVYHAQVRGQRPPPKRLLAMVGKGRSRDGRTDVASNVKQALADIIESKYSLSRSRKPARKP